MPVQLPVLAPPQPPPTVRRQVPPPRLARRYRVPLLAVLAISPLYGVWAAHLATVGGDLAAQYAWAGFFTRHPDVPYGLFWFGGLHTANYSVLSPPLMALFGVRTVSVLAGLSATWLLAALLVRTAGRVAPWPALIGALGLWYDVALGRTTFALGLAFALAAVLALAGRPPRPARLTAAALAALCATMSSPVAGLFLLVAGAGHLLDRQYAKALVLALPPVAVVAATTLLFPYQGEQPMSAGRMVLPLLLSLGTALTAPRDWRVVRAGAFVYAAGVVLCWLIPSPIGSNVERLAVHLAPAVLLAALLSTRSGAARNALPPLRLRALAAVAIFAVVHLCLTSTNPLRGAASAPAWATHTGPVVAELHRLGADRGRVELPTDRDHRGATLLSPHVQLMRGWNQQLDQDRGRMFYAGDLDGPRYLAWLRQWAVGYVVVHDGPPEATAVRETALIRDGQDWLEPVWHDRHWKIYRVHDTLPLASAPAHVLKAGEADVTLSIPRPATVTVRIVHSPWLRAEGACVGADGPWTRLTVPRAGVYRLTSGYGGAGAGANGC
ncbi:hypothetical protein ACWD1Y_44645 [Streptomyces sp. NPDC002814]